jgi:hypothetical protein
MLAIASAGWADYSRGIGEGHSSRIRFYVAAVSAQRKYSSRCRIGLWTDESFGPSVSSGFETKDRRVQCPSRTHGIEIFS